MSIEMTQEQLDKMLSAAYDSVNLINAILSKDKKTSIDLYSLKANIDHLNYIVSGGFFQENNNVLLRNVITSGQAWLDLDIAADDIVEIDHVALLKSDTIFLTQQLLDSFAKTRNYDGILSACTYAASSVPKFSGEGLYCVHIRDTIWKELYDIMDKVLSGELPYPSHASDIIEMLSTPEWPV